ncbi:MAG: NAD(P)-dependent oxidoreductase, partial [Acidobacteriota bacterium]
MSTHEASTSSVEIDDCLPFHGGEWGSQMEPNAMVSSVLLTGFGFIGRHVSMELMARGHRVSVLDRRPDIPLAITLGIQPVIGDVRDAALMRQLIPHYDRVVHLAGLLGTSELVDDPSAAVDTNITGALN